MPSPMERTLKELKGNPACLFAQKVEHWNPWARKRIDLWGADVQAIFSTHILAIQVTSITGNAEHVRDALKSKEVNAWVNAGGHFEVWAWRKLKKVGWEAKKTVIGAETWSSHDE